VTKRFDDPGREPRQILLRPKKIPELLENFAVARKVACGVFLLHLVKQLSRLFKPGRNLCQREPSLPFQHAPRMHFLHGLVILFSLGNAAILWIRPIRASGSNGF
jgi:hypothetical protein